MWGGRIVTPNALDVNLQKSRWMVIIVDLTRSISAIPAKGGSMTRQEHYFTIQEKNDTQHMVPRHLSLLLLLRHLDSLIHQRNVPENF
jgi:hypothetical protein